MLCHNSGNAQARACDSGRLRWNRRRSCCTVRAPPLKHGKPQPAIISASSSTRSACLRHARKPWMHSTCAQPRAQIQCQACRRIVQKLKRDVMIVCPQKVLTINRGT